MKLNLKEFEGKQIVLVGMREMGKSTWLKWFASVMKPFVIFDTLGEHTWTERRYVVSPDVKDEEEVRKEFLDFFDEVDLKKIKMIGIEEADMFLPSRKSYPFKFRKIISTGSHAEKEGMMRHGNPRLTYVWITRRPAMIHTDLRELADYLIIFRLDGVNDIEALNAVKTNLGNMAASLVPTEHKFIFYRKGFEPKIMEPVKIEPVRRR